VEGVLGLAVRACISVSAEAGVLGRRRLPQFGHRLGYETLCAQVSDSISWRGSADRHRRAGAAPDHPYEDHHDVWRKAVAAMNDALLAGAVTDVHLGW